MIEKAFSLSSDKQIQDYLNSSFVELYSQTQKIQETQLAYVFGDVMRNYCDALPENKDPQQDDEERSKTEEWGCGTGRITEIKAAKGVCSSGFVNDSDSFEELSAASCQPNMNPDSEKEPAVCSNGIQEVEPVITCNDSTQTISGFEVDKEITTEEVLVEADQNSDEVIKEIFKDNSFVEADEYKTQVIKAAKKAVEEQIADKKVFFKKLLQDYIKEHQNFSENTKQKTVCKIHDVETFGPKKDKKHKIIPECIKNIDIAIEELEKLLKALEEIVDLTPVECGEKAEKIWIDYEHILAPLIKINCETGQYYVAGFHHDWQGKIQASGIIKSEVIKQFENGVYEIEWSYENAATKKSGMFPDAWSLVTVIKKVLEALRSPIELGKKENGSLIMIGKTKENIKIEIVFEIRKNNLTGKIITAYPYTKKDKKNGEL